MMDTVYERASGLPCNALRCGVYESSIRWRRRATTDVKVTVVGDIVTWTDSTGQQGRRVLAPGDGVEGGIRVDVAFDGSGRVENVRALPLRPIWPGFIINTLFYAIIWLLLIFGWRMHLRQVRKWQGYCPMCKYDLQGQATRYHHAPRGEVNVATGTSSTDNDSKFRHSHHAEHGGTRLAGCPECGWGRRVSP